MHELIKGYPRCGSLLSTSSSLREAHAAWCAQKREAKGLSSRLRASFAEATGQRRGVAPGSFVDLLVNATDKATGESLSDLERTNQAFVMVMSGGRAASCCVLTHTLQRCMLMLPTHYNDVVNATRPKESLSDLERTNQVLVMIMSGEYIAATRGTDAF